MAKVEFPVGVDELKSIVPVDPNTVPIGPRQVSNSLVMEVDGIT
jgi:hypothetical protein